MSRYWSDHYPCTVLQKHNVKEFSELQYGTTHRLNKPYFRVYLRCACAHMRSLSKYVNIVPKQCNQMSQLSKQSLFITPFVWKKVTKMTNCSIKKKAQQTFISFLICLHKKIHLPNLVSDRKTMKASETVQGLITQRLPEHSLAF